MNPMNPIVLLILAIASEIVGTASLKASEGFSKLGPSVLVVVGYGLAFYLLAQSLKHFPISTAYAIWSGLGTAGTVAVGVILWREALDPARIIGIVLIILGVVVLNAFSTAAAH